MQKDDILAEIRRTAQENGGKPLGVARFESVTGIRPYDWQKYWARIGDAQREAGFAPNTLVGAYDDDFLIEKVVDLIRELKKFPTGLEMRIKKRSDSTFPNDGVFVRFGNKTEFFAKVLNYCKDNPGYADVVEILGPITEASTANKPGMLGSDNSSEMYGEVYLFKSGRYYKIGMTKDIVRRGSELRIQLPEKMDLIHSIKTDDPSGIEAYWHRRFADKRMNGEWFDLNPADIKAFRRWRRIY
jgi:hypothetical protein